MTQGSYDEEVRKGIGDYQSFFRDLLERLAEEGMDITGRAISHVCYRTNPSGYEAKRDELKKISTAYAEHEFGGRMVTEFKLRQPLDLGGGFSTQMIELLPHKPGRAYAAGLENFGVLIGIAAEKFAEEHRVTGVKHRPRIDIPFITFENGRTVKFYEYSLEKLVENDGFKFVPVEA